jgi:hypothetical protein
VRRGRSPAALSLPGEVGDHGRCGRVEPDHIEHAAIVRIRDREAGRGHADHDPLRGDVGLAPVVRQRLRRVDTAELRLVVGVDHESNPGGSFRRAALKCVCTVGGRTSTGRRSVFSALPLSYGLSPGWIRTNDLSFRVVTEPQGLVLTYEGANTD